jgi:hypothetical protein
MSACLISVSSSRRHEVRDLYQRAPLTPALPAALGVSTPMQAAEQFGAGHLNERRGYVGPDWRGALRGKDDVD